LTVEDNAIDAWTKDGGAGLKKAFEESVDAAVSALMCDLGLAEEAVGEYYLGKLAMNRKEFEDADAHFQKAIQLDPAMLDAQNGRAVNLAHNGQLDDAIGILRAVTESSPEYGPAWFNLAWWYATEKEDAANAQACYEKAKALGMPAHKKLDKLGK
jgi:tetratricopeptide (TPR) repeat protein